MEGLFFLPDFIKKYIISIKDQDNVSFYSKNEFFQYAVKNKAKFENYENGDCTICLQALLSPEEVIELKNILIKENIVILDEQSSKEYSNLNEESLSHNDSKLDELEVIENEKMDVKNMSFLKFNNNLEERKTPILTYLKENITLECIFMESKNLFNIFFSFHKYKTINKLRNKIIAVTNECNHSFHCSCLTDWLGTKMECPIDRKQIILDI